MITTLMYTWICKMGKTNPCWTKNPTLGCRILNYPTDPDMRLAHNLVRGGPFPYPYTI